MPIFGMRPFDSHESLAERRRRGLIYAATFCLLLFAIDLGRLSKAGGGSGSFLDFLPVVALITGGLALAILHTSSHAAASRAPRSQKQDPDAHPELERLSSFTEWRHSRSSTFRHFGLQFPDIESPVAKPAANAKGPRGRRAKSPDKAIDPWSKALEDFDNRSGDRHS